MNLNKGFQSSISSFWSLIKLSFDILIITQQLSNKMDVVFIRRSKDLNEFFNILSNFWIKMSVHKNHFLNG